ncbi:hypothetical protein M9H77_34165 [Catharanthus roseus]|uniref:Uncharacterized protein n=1 Tax=Catharanthus roseus TaxID=4058 RepID=A0ACB9ZP05_CATRO|nr:hypothetical protein M9H77_34165 [Catharanthus roseus]
MVAEETWSDNEISSEDEEQEEVEPQEIEKNEVLCLMALEERHYSKAKEVEGNEKDECRKASKSIVEENGTLKEEVEKLTNDLAKFTKENATLDLMLGNQRLYG